MSEVIKPDGTTELVECLDILMSALEVGTSEVAPEFTEDEFETALWQTCQLAMTLLFDNLAMHQMLEEVMAELEEREDVGKIIRPKLITP